MAGIRQNFQGIWDDVNNFFDKWNLLGFSILIVVPGLVAIWMVSKQNFTANLALVIFTAAYTFVAFNQMRETRRSRKHPGTLTIRPDFEWDEERGTHVFGLRNFGTGPAINLRGCAIVLDDTEDDDAEDEDDEDASEVLENQEDCVLRFSKKDHHLSLPEGELLPLTIDSQRINDHFDDLWNEKGELRNKYEGKEIEFYYTFESDTGEPYPRDWKKPTEMDLEEVVEKSDSPRTVKLEEIKEKCPPSQPIQLQQRQQVE